MAKQLKTHWTQRIPIDTPLSAEAIKIVPGKRVVGGKMVNKGWIVHWNKKGKVAQIRHIVQNVVIELEGPQWTWGRLVTLLATLKLIKIDGTVRYTANYWINLQ